MTKEVMESILLKMQDALVNATEEDYGDDDWYADFIYDDEITEESEKAEEEYETEEDFLAIEAMKYPELYPIVRNIIQKITEINQNNGNAPLDVDSEWAAGTYFATKLAETTKSEEDILLFSNHLKTRDLDHEESGEMYGVQKLNVWSSEII